MKNIAAIIFAVLMGSIASFARAEPASDRPVLLGVFYSERPGADFRLEVARDVCGGEVQVRYAKDWRFDATTSFRDIEISAEAWTKFRKAMAKLAGSSLPNEKVDEEQAKVFWTFYVEYPDLKIRAASADHPATVSDFAQLRAALHELTGGRLF